MRVDHHISLLSKPRTFVLRDLVLAAVSPGDRVLDAGTGSGFLATLAALAGASEVVTVDREHSGLAVEVARANGVEDRIRHVTADLNNWQPDGQFNVVLGMLYENDPRRDDWLNSFMPELLDRTLIDGGLAIPAKVRYTARLADSPELAYSEACRRVESSVGAVSRRLGLDLSPLSDWALQSPLMQLMPPRQWDGTLNMVGRSLGSDVIVFEIDYVGGPGTWPERIELPVSDPGDATCVVWTQELLGSGGELIFANESVSWLDRPVRLEADSFVSLELGDTWRRRNVVSVRLPAN